MLFLLGAAAVTAFVGSAAAVGTYEGITGKTLFPDDKDDNSSSNYDDSAEREREAKLKARKEKNKQVWGEFRTEVRGLEAELKVQIKDAGKVSLKNLSVEKPSTQVAGYMAAAIRATTRYNTSTSKSGIPTLYFSALSMPSLAKGRLNDLSNEILLIDKVLLNEFLTVESFINSATTKKVSDHELKKLKNKLEKYISADEIMEFMALIKEIQENKPRIASAGALKAGKSTMMNCLTGDIEDQRFKTDIVRATVKEQVYVQDGYLFVDTPGIDANEGDDREAIKALKLADAVLFAHNINGGELDVAERTFLEKIAKNWENPKDFIKKTAFVLTHLDLKADDKNRIESEVTKQVEKIFGVTPKIVSISSSRYLKGMRENKTLLIEKSNYSELHAASAELLKAAAKDKQVRFKKRVKSRVNYFKKVLTESKKRLESEKTSLKKEHENKIKKAKKVVAEANTKIATKYELCLERMK